MTADAREQSWKDGEPVLLVDIVRDTVHWRYANTMAPYVYNGDTYLPTTITRSEISQGRERNKLQITVTLPADLDVADNWRPYPPSQIIGITIFETHRGEADLSVEWSGQVIGPHFTPSELTLTCEPSSLTARTAGLQRAWQRACPHVLYGQGDGLCNADPDLFKALVTITDLDGLTATSAGFEVYPSGRFAGGYIEWVRDDGLIERRSIASHIGDSVVLRYGSDKLPAGTVVTAYPGCAHNTADCNDFFDNLPNYGGQPNAPVRSPFDGNPVF